MYAIVDISGKQYKVQKNDKILVNRLTADEGKSVEFDQIRMLGDDGKVTLGTPLVKGATVKAKIVEHTKDDKVIIFKKKRRKGYQTRNGHRQYLSRIEIQDIKK